MNLFFGVHFTTLKKKTLYKGKDLYDLVFLQAQLRHEETVHDL